MASIRLVGVGKSFGGTPVVQNIDLAIADGEFAVVVGPSGCGKSTLLRMIAGLDSISAGQLWIGDSLANRLPPQARNIAMVFQSYALFPHLTARHNIGFGPRIRGESRAATAAKVERAAEVLGLFGTLDRYPQHLSGGQRQRVAMGRSIVRDPRVFLFDEPLSNLDTNLRVSMRAEIKALHQRLGCTMVYVTHDQIEAMTLADRIIVMQAGRIEQVGAPLDLYDRPRTRFVASFLGAPPMSFVPARIERAGGATLARSVAGDVLARLLDTSAVALRDGQSIELGIRPEDFQLSEPGLGLAFVIDVVEPTGAETLLWGKVHGAPVQCVFRARIGFRPNETIHLGIDPSRLHVFDGTTGLRQ